MSSEAIRRVSFGRLLGGLAVLIIALDQLSKAYFVWLLGDHQHAGFLSFAGEYFTLWGGQRGAVTEAYGTLAGSNHSVFGPLIWVWEPWIAWNLTTNTGAAWSLFAGNSYALSFVSIAMALLLWYVWHRRFRAHLGMTWALGAIIGGALGNFIDRFRLREVVDFIDVKIPWIGRLIPTLGDPYDFPIFNVADSCAVCGTLALAIYLICADLRGIRRKRRAGRAEPFQPLDEGLRLDQEAKARLRALAGAGGAHDGTDLTRFVAGGDDDAAPAGGN